MGVNSWVLDCIDRLIHRFFNSPTSKASAATKAALHSLYAQYRGMALRGDPLPSVWDTGLRIFSQNDEDGIVLFIFGVTGTQTRTFVEIGTGDGLECNCANLAINFGWHGLFVDGNADAIERGRTFYAQNPDTFLHPPKLVCAHVKRENVNDVIRNAGFEGEIDLLSIDIDGNDYWIWDAVDCISPRVVVIETHIEFGMRSIVVPYDETYVYPGVDPCYHGASPVAMAKLANRKGYRLVGANRYGFNTFYVRNDVGSGILPEISVESVLQHPRNVERSLLFEPVKHFDYLEVE